MLTRYHITVENFDGRGRTLLRSILSGVTVLVSEPLLERLRAGEPPPEDLSPAVRAVLQEHFLVPSDAFDRARALGRIRRKVEKRDVFALTVMTTGACNMACRYCFQNQLVRPSRLEEDRADRLARWVSARVDAVRPRAFMLHLYGGEPLLNFPWAEDLVARLRPSLARRGVRWSLSLTTNGTLLTPGVVGRLALMGCTTAVISLDGPPDVQNYRRPLRNRADSYDLVLAGVRNALRRFDVMLRVNVDRQNAGRVPDLLGELKDRGLADDPRFYVSLEVVGPILHPTAHVERELLSQEEAGDTLAGLLRLQAELGFRVFGNMPTEISCEHIMRNALTVDHHGEIYPCPGFVGFPEFRLGAIDEGIAPARQDALSAIRPWESGPCLDCPYLPQCQGGCKSCAVISGGGEPMASYGRTYCRKEFFDRTFPAFLRALYGPGMVGNPLPPGWGTPPARPGC